MKLQLNKLMAGLVMAGGVAALVGCGGGDAPTLGAATNVTARVTATNTTAINTAKAVVAATGETGANYALPSTVVFTSRVGGGTVPAIPANSTLNLNPTTVPGAIADFKMTAAGTTKTVEGVVKPGSCNFEVTGPASDILDGYVVGQTYAINPCSFTIPTANASIDTTVTVTPTITLGTTTVPASRTIAVIVNSNGSVTAQVTTTVNGVTTTTPVPLAPAGTVSITTGGQPTGGQPV